MEPANSAVFVVWTPGQIYHWGLGEYVEPVGRSADDPQVEGALVWSGSFPVAGTYYVVVEPSAVQPGNSYYLLEVQGGSVDVAVSAPEASPSPAVPATAATQEVASRTNAELSGKLVIQTTFGGPFYLINVDGTGLQRITGGMDPVWSPDGEQIAFVRWEDPRGVWVVDLETGNEWRVFDWHEARYPSWSPDGEQIVFSRQYRGRTEETKSCVLVGDQQICRMRRPDPHYNLGVVRVNDGYFWEPLPSTSERSLTPDWSPNGEQIVYEDVYGLVVQSADGQERYQITDRNLDTSPAWSPDGQQVAFVRRQHDHWEIYVVDADGSNLRRLTISPALADGSVASSVSPAWSPDGDYIAFLTDGACVASAGCEWEVWVMEADGSNPAPLFGSELDSLTLAYSFNGERAIDWSW
jgi:TolB protein